MTSGIPLFIAAPTGRCRLALRRYRYDEDHDGHLHDATVFIGEDEPCGPRNPDGSRDQWVADERVGHDDPRWPAACACGEPFRAADRWQVNELDWHEGTGGRFAWGIGSWSGPPGAMIRAPWRDVDGRPPAWLVFLPNGTSWCTNDRAVIRDGGKRFGPYWDVTGEPPRITVAPSIDDRGTQPWHGWIRDGQLVRVGG